MTFWDLIPAAALAGSLLFGPGWLALRVLGRAGVDSFVWAPAPSLVLVVATGGIARWLDIPVRSAGGVTALVVVVAVAALAALRFRVARPPAPRGDTPSAAVVSAALTTSLASVSLMVVRALSSPLAWAQMPDDIFHVGAVTWMVRHDSAWIGDAPQYAQPVEPPIAYPGVWHALTSVIASWTGTPPLAASHAVLVVVAGLVWPSSLLALAWQVVDRTPRTTITVALAALAFFAMPYQLMAWGVLWPYLLGLALLPAVLAALYLVCSRCQHPDQSVGPPLALLATTGGLAALAHPSIVYSAALIGLPLGLCALVAATSHRRTFIVGAMAVVCLVPAWLARPDAMFSLKAGSRPITAAQAADLVVGAFSPLPALAVMLVLLVAIALVVACRDRKHWWIWWGVLVPLAVTGLAWTFPGALSRTITWPWWNDLPRIRSLAVVSAVIGVARLGGWVSERAAVPEASRRRVAGAATAAVAALAGGALLVGGIHVANTYHPQQVDQWWATPSDRTDLATLASLVPRGATVAANPYTGGTQLYLTRDLNLLYPTEWMIHEHPDRQLVGAALDEIRSRPDVCRAARELRVDFAVSGGSPHAWGVPYASSYAGMERTSEDRGFLRVATAGRFTLWKVPTCVT